MLGLLKNIFDENIREVRRLSKKVETINRLEPGMRSLSDRELRAKTEQFRERLAGGETLDDILPEAFAVVREASRRVLELRHFDVQLIGGMVLHEGKIAEMKTGEGKTLVATLPAYLNALTGRGVHIVTVNDYLATRDSEWMGQVYKFLGLSVGLIVHGLDFEERKRAYNADITYGTNNEFGFDYLRDNMVFHPDHMVQRGLHYAIVDEVDSILIDEARTPLIISGTGDKPKDLYKKVARIIPRLKKEEDYTVDEKARIVTLTEKGVERVENMLGVDNLYDDVNIELSHHVNQALHAHVIMKRDVDYVVKDGQIIIVDEFTGRLMFGRRYSEGLHQAIEAKEGVDIEKESQTLATITFQNYFRMYEKLAGMTGTAVTEEEEFRKIYKLDVVVIPTNKPMIRKDMPDVVYRTEAGKFNAVVDEIERRTKQGQPVLVGTISIEKSERLSEMLKKRGIEHQVLNAKFHDLEAHIVAQAGRKGAVTVSTNMAGRGTDILLGGNPGYLARQEMLKQGYESHVIEEAASYSAVEDPGILRAREHYRRLYEAKKVETDKEHEEVVKLGGLHIIGTERHESRRIDNQLRGRSGRQGDPGSSQFYISLEDDLMRLFGAENIMGLMDRLGMDDSIPIENNLISRAIENAQRRVESRNFDIRKHVLEYDDVMNQQREVIYGQRRKVLMGEDMKESILEMIGKVVNRTVDRFAGESRYSEEWDLKGMLEQARHVFLPRHTLTLADLSKLEDKEIRELLLGEAWKDYEKREKELGPENMRELERLVTLRVVDNKWMGHLDAMDQLRHGIGLRAYGQRDPLVEYKYEAYDMFNQMIEEIQEEIVRYVYHVTFVERPKEREDLVENRGEGEVKRTPVTSRKIGRNDPCPCGSGKKYKKCCGK
ncbi:MAG: preprotein translocase subunit SecA [Peptococcaceae bacterium]|nr:preprotein translocase subunit SecA [Peptococcaceae bacterium]MDH7524771.1 preprotein translocase subunit SecA [Peptococcaceae bacterium]